MAWRYHLDAPLLVWTASPSPEFHGKWFSVFRNRGRIAILVHAGYSWDGCTGVPDIRGSRDASAVHDAAYQFCEAIAAESGWTVSQVQRWADDRFFDLLLARGANVALATLYYIGVRLLGGPYHWLARVLGGPCSRRCAKRRGKVST